YRQGAWHRRSCRLLHQMKLLAVEGEHHRVAFDRRRGPRRYYRMQAQSLRIQPDAGRRAEIIERHDARRHTLAAGLPDDADRLRPQAAPAVLAGITLHEI